MAAEVVAVLESVLRKRMREEQWAADKKERALAEKKKAIKSRKLIFARAKQYAQEYNSQNHYKYTLKSATIIKVELCGEVFGIVINGLPANMRGRILPTPK
ncbi:hypothetical protein E2562_020122, partial [Oryza meyeriana var. granulata]